LMTICSGELRQIFDRHAVPHLHSEQAWKEALVRYDKRILAKTASLFAAATESASVLSDAPPGATSSLREYGLLLGTGFQIIDDILDFQGDQEVLGKPVGSDLREGIVTLPVLYFLREYPDDESVAKVIRDGGDDGLVREVVAAIRESGAVARAMERARDLIDQSQAALTSLPEGEPRKIMHELADFVVSRKV
ncbi:MAG TPA: polyprenyl synthetase family protein, partial [Anaerolineae bacterium]|nr:polyprenyl synthetase family protein [Anaerolineae bacterium]